MDNNYEYKTSHPWLNFSLDMRGVLPRLWMSLGEAQSKCMNIAGVPLQPETAKRLHKIYLAKGVHATTAIEGNSLSEDDVLKKIEHRQLNLPVSQGYLETEVKNIIELCNDLKGEINHSGFGNLDRLKIQEFNRIILKGLPLPEEVIPGEIRKHSVVVANYRGAPAKECEYLLDKMCSWLNSEAFRSQNENERIAYGVLKAIVAHIYLAWIHPFGDGNGRTARIVEFYILMASGVPSPATQLLSNHYNQTRSEYYRQLSRTSSELNGNLIPFIEYAVQGLVDGLKIQVEWIRRQHVIVTWRNFVFDSFKGKSGATSDRQRNLVLDLSEKTDPVTLNKIPEISPRMAIAYARKTTKTMRRDINALLKMQPSLIVKKSEGITANIGMITAFLPKRHTLPDGHQHENPISEAGV
ncbi:MAG: Fic family protein [Elusimicrobiota bacterium]|jgi:Fic family protein